MARCLSGARLVFLALLLVALAACTPLSPAAPSAAGEAAPARVLTVYAAASLKDAFEALEPGFEAANPGVDVVFNLAGSQQLAQQLASGAPGDLFASANARQMNVAIEAGRVAAGTAQIFVGNHLVVVAPADNPAGLESLGDLAQPGLKLVLADAAVPVGEYSLAVLENAEASGSFAAGFAEVVTANVVSYEENVRAVLNKVVLGEADAGIVYTSDVMPSVSDQVVLIEIPADINVLATYPVAVLTDAELPDAAQAFVDLLLAPEGQAVLGEFGFLPVSSLPQ